MEHDYDSPRSEDSRYGFHSTVAVDLLIALQGNAPNGNGSPGTGAPPGVYYLYEKSRVVNYLGCSGRGFRLPRATRRPQKK